LPLSLGRRSGEFFFFCARVRCVGNESSGPPQRSSADFRASGLPLVCFYLISLAFSFWVSFTVTTISKRVPVFHSLHSPPNVARVFLDPPFLLREGRPQEIDCTMVFQPHCDYGYNPWAEVQHLSLLVVCFATVPSQTVSFQKIPFPNGLFPAPFTVPLVSRRFVLFLRIDPLIETASVPLHFNPNPLPSLPHMKTLPFYPLHLVSGRSYSLNVPSKYSNFPCSYGLWLLPQRRQAVRR